MSADNTIVIAKFPDGWRVEHVQAAENILYYPEGSTERKQILKDYFGKSKVFNTEGEAYQQALKLEEEYEYVEYGINNLGELEAFEDDIRTFETEFFECACCSREHLIIARKVFWEGVDKENNKYKEIDISLEFVLRKGDWEYNTGFILIRFFKKVWWRLKEAFKIIIKGYYKVEDSWQPVYVERELENKGIRGISETKRLGETLIKFAEDSEKFWRLKNE